jgi:Ser/Thr protein kinase RdoA (MazF antagonist)
MQLHRVAASFGIAPTRVMREPSLSSTVHRVESDGEVVFLKRHVGGEPARIRWAAAVAERLRAHGIAAPRFLTTRPDGLPWAVCDGHLYTATTGIDGQRLAERDLAVPATARRLGAFLARVHGVLGGADAIAPPRPAPWDDRDHPARIARARRELASLPRTPARADMLEALGVLTRHESSLSVGCGPDGVVHGDFWPGNLLIAGDEIAVLDLEYSCRAPLLLDVAHFADLAFRSPAGLPRLAPASAFARAYATAAGWDRGALGALPRVLIAARACSLLWIVERHLEDGPSQLDALVAGDLRLVAFVASAADRWARELTGARAEAPAMRKAVAT